MEIYCPECEWEPPSSATWTCECGHSWHTFDTHGRCPECGTVWRETQCHECRAWSPHHDWYHDLPPVDVDAVTEGQEAPLTEGGQHRSRLRSGARLRGPGAPDRFPAVRTATVRTPRRVLP
ncbi:putative RNA-binding Zn-ribbon protein involved in translation (DUF1610 family) [Salinibacter ruber]|uniref:RNA-binding Zn-ribbon protein involved in translation (DUF1610 family) n=1 Tax=Salinibacter ruber TaxID=146919 RepID=A0A9X2U1H0_9BACT|nr:putative RNA-binding Zn-ribbon protein involved in translation (DUF1610 family) [Salinibacter ruber]MCS3864044.1 putative RNA-binding Zn-ribbon protein involved in translation (DUF1610 family) [Salinibacter ruber]MCS4150823.1 putative RNA-binding Zn-ribbon protein involved in translation (DUF1610 family) [Salinibacter ruber]